MKSKGTTRTRPLETRMRVCVCVYSRSSHCLDLSLSLRRTFSTRPLTNTHDWPAASASEATALWRYTNLFIIIIIIIMYVPWLICYKFQKRDLRTVTFETYVFQICMHHFSPYLLFSFHSGHAYAVHCCYVSQCANMLFNEDGILIKYMYLLKGCTTQRCWKKFCIRFGTSSHLHA